LSIVLSIYFSARGYSLRYLWVPPDDRKNFFNRFPAYLHHSESLLLWSDAIWRNFTNLTFRHPCLVVGTPRYPQMVEKIFLIVFPSYLHHSESLLLWSDAIWRNFPNLTFRHPCLVVGTPRYPQMVEKIFLIIVPAYLHHSESLLLWSDAIYKDFLKNPFFDPYPEVPKSISNTSQCCKNSPKPYNFHTHTI